MLLEWLVLFCSLIVSVCWLLKKRASKNEQTVTVIDTRGGAEKAAEGRKEGVHVLSDEEVEGFEDPEVYIRKLLQEGRSLKDVIIHGMSPLNYFLALYDEDFVVFMLKYKQKEENKEGGMEGDEKEQKQQKGSETRTIDKIVLKERSKEKALVGSQREKEVNRNDTIDIHSTITGGYTSLHFACDNDMREVVALLIERKAHIEATTEDMRVVGHYESGGKTPLHLAALKGYDNIVQLLLSAGANIHAQDFDSNTPFLLACMSHHLSAARLLDTTTALPSEEWLVEKARADRAEAMLRSKKELSPTSSLMQVHVLSRLWSAQECQSVLRELLAATEETGWTANRHRAYATTDIQSCQVPKVDLWVRQSLRTRLFPRMKHLYFPSSSDDVELSFRDLFYVKYSMDGQKGLSIHLDGSILSFNLLLNPASQFTGGGTFIEHLDRTFNIDEGDCFVHSGRVRHAGTSVRSGVRYLLVGFVDVRLAGSRSLISCDVLQ